MLETNETTRSVYLDACKNISNCFLQDGFTYFPSHPKCKRKSGDLTCEIAFSSSYYNIKGHQITIDVFLWGKSRELKKWREANSFERPTDDFFGSSLSSLVGPPFSSRWNLANPDSRCGVIKEISEKIKNFALREFSSLENHSVTIEKILAHEFKGSRSPSSDLEYVLCFGGKTAADNYIESYFKKYPNYLKEFESEFLRMSTLNLKNERIRGIIQDLAYYCITQNLKVSVTS